MDIGQELRFQGYWWLPHSHGEKRAGELWCSRDGKVELSLFDSFSEVSIPQKGRKIDIILGMSDKGKSITLVDYLFKGKLIFQVSHVRSIVLSF